jgi:hypothetical protein
MYLTMGNNRPQQMKENKDDRLRKIAERRSRVHVCFVVGGPGLNLGLVTASLPVVFLSLSMQMLGQYQNPFPLRHVIYWSLIHRLMLYNLSYC